MAFSLEKYIEPNFNDDKFLDSPDANLKEVVKDGVAPDNYHATSIFPEYFKVEGSWHLAKDSRMDSVPVWNGSEIKVIEFRNLKAGDKVVLGRTEDASEGIYVHNNCWALDDKQNAQNIFAFREGRSRETGFSHDYKNLVDLLNYEKEHNGFVEWILGPACSFDYKAREIMSKLIDKGYCQALQAGNALATHDLEGAYLGTALGCDIKNQSLHELGHYNHLDTINKIREYESIEKFIEGEKIDNGIMYSIVKNNIPYVLSSSIRDDGPLPEVIHSAYDAQDHMRNNIRKATTVITLATTLHTIANGNMTPSYRVLDDGSIRPVYFYMVDISEFAVNKLSDRGSLTAKGIVTNVQDFMHNLSSGLNL